MTKAELEHYAPILIKHRMQELGSIDTHQTTRHNLKKYYREEKMKKKRNRKGERLLT